MKAAGALTVLFLAAAALYGQSPTFYEDVAPIIIENCTPCHRRGDVAPFPLESYDDVAAKAKLIQLATETRYMPPWMPDPAYRRFENERILDEKEIQLIKQWVAAGKKPGNPALMPKIPPYSESSLIGRKPDLVVSMQQPVKIPGNNKESFVVVKFPGKIDAERDVEAIEFIPGNRKLVHHVNFFIYEVPEGMDYFSGPGTADLGTMKTDEFLWLMNIAPAGRKLEFRYYAGWVPGMSPAVFRGNFGFRLPRRFVILCNTIHYSFSPVEETDASKFYVFYKKEKAERTLELINIGSGGGLSEVVPPLQLAPGKIQSFSTRSEVPIDISVMYIAPHMHLLGKSYRAYILDPQKDTIPLIRINKWDFNWQEMYRFNPMLLIQKGSTIVVEGVYDNTSNNPNNPFSPPQTIYSTGNMGTMNEMLNMVFLFTLYRPGDEKLSLEK